MERGLKERLVGAAVLVALAVIFIPMLLDDTPSGPGPITSTNIPDKPEGPNGFDSRVEPIEPEPVALELPQPQPDDTTADQTSPTVESQPQPADSQPPQSDSPAADEPALTSDMPAPETAAPQPSGWVIQLGSFAQQDNARELDQKLREAGYPAFVEPVSQGGERVYRVRVGPEVMRGEAEKVRDEIAAEFEIKGIVVSYP